MKIFSFRSPFRLEAGNRRKRGQFFFSQKREKKTVPVSSLYPPRFYMFLTKSPGEITGTEESEKCSLFLVMI